MSVYRENPHKIYVKVRADFTPDGRILPLMLRAEDGEACVMRTMTDARPVELKLGLDRLLPKVQFIYDL